MYIESVFTDMRNRQSFHLSDASFKGHFGIFKKKKRFILSQKKNGQQAIRNLFVQHV